ncbi:MAG: AI-2E family transporter [Rhodospirillales bacterium]
MVSKTVRNLIILATLAVLVLIVWAVPAVLVISLFGFAVALVLSFPVHLLSRIMPRGLAVLLAFLILLAVVLLVFYVLVPLLLSQMGALVSALPGLIDNLERYLIGALEALNRKGLLPSTPEDIAARLGEDLTASLGVITGNILGGTLGLVYGTFSFAVTLFAVIFIAASLLANVRNFKAIYLTSVPSRYRRDARDLWDALAYAMSRYLEGLAFVLLLQGAFRVRSRAYIAVNRGRESASGGTIEIADEVR